MKIDWVAQASRLLRSASSPSAFLRPKKFAASPSWLSRAEFFGSSRCSQTHAPEAWPLDSILFAGFTSARTRRQSLFLQGTDVLQALCHGPNRFSGNIVTPSAKLHFAPRLAQTESGIRHEMFRDFHKKRVVIIKPKS